jgi:hypothetical protein
MTPVAIMLKVVVPSLLVRTPPRRGVQVLFRLNAEIKRLNSTSEVFISLSSRDFNGARI